MKKYEEIGGNYENKDSLYMGRGTKKISSSSSYLGVGTSSQFPGLGVS